MESKTLMRIVLTRADFDQIASESADLPREYVPVPEWSPEGVDPADVFVCVRALAGFERDQYEASLSVQRGNNRVLNFDNARAKLAALCMIDESTGERIYSDKEVQLLGKRSAKALDRIFDVCRRMNGLTREDVEQLTEELKNGQSG